MAHDVDIEYRVILDELACCRLRDRYSYAEISQDPDLFVSVFTEDATFGSLRGHDAIREACAGFVEDMQSLSALRISDAGSHVQVDGDAAVGTFYIVAHMCVPSDDGPDRIIIMDGGYHADFVRTPDGWRISRMCGIKDPDKYHDIDLRAGIVAGASDWIAGR